MSKYSGKYFINGRDVYDTYGMVFEKGAFDALLKFPQTKDGYSEEWADQTGADYLAYPDTVLQSQSIDVPFVLLATHRNDFFAKYNLLRSLLLPGAAFSMDVVDLNMRFKLRYSAMNSFTKITKLKSGQVCAKLTLTLIDDYPDQRSIFGDALAAAKAAGYTVDATAFEAAIDDLPYSYRKEAQLVLAPGITKNGGFAGVDANGNIIPFNFSRASSATYVDKNGTVQTAAAYMPRIDYSSGVPRYLFEDTSMNLVLWSNDMTKPYYTKTSISILSDKVLSPDKVNSIPMLYVPYFCSSAALSSQAIPVSMKGIYTLSFYVYKGTKTTGYKYRIANAANNSDIVPLTDYTAQLGNGWTRVSVSCSLTASAQGVILYLLDETDIPKQGSCAIWGVQLERNGNATSLIPATGTASVRDYDCFESANGLAYSSAASLYTDILKLNDDTSNSNNWMPFGTSGEVLVSDGTYLCDFNNTSVKVLWGNSKIVSVVDAETSNLYNAGNAGTESPVEGDEWNQCVAPLYTVLLWITRLKELVIFNRRLSDAEAKALTA